MSNVQVIDMVFLVLIFLMCVHGYMKGFIEEIFSWASLVFAVWVAVLLYPHGATIIRARIMQTVRYVPEILSFLAIFVIIMMFSKMVEHIMKDMVSGAKMKGANKFLGALFGIIEGLAFTTLILFVIAVQPFFDSSGLIGNSLFAEILLPLIKIPMKQGNNVINTALLILAGPGFPGLPV